jgi:GNAT superfamily N-acetyltransferase
MSYEIRLAVADDGAQLRTIEWCAGQAFADVGLAQVAADEPMSTEELATYAEASRGWVVTADAEEPVGYVLVDVVDDAAHVAQLSVHPDHQGQSLSRRLLAVVEAWAVEKGLPRVSLTTFRRVPWNRPLYEHLGFTVMAEAEIGSQLAALVAHEAANGLDPAQRVCMARPVS